MLVSNTDRTKWGSYGDRKDSFDDEKEIDAFIRGVKKNASLLDHIGDAVGREPMYFRPHFYGQFGVDLSLVDENNNPVVDFEFERWSAWDKEWPAYYRHIHFLGRKNKYLLEDRPFFMVFLNYSRTKCLVVEKEVILQYPTITKKFKKKNVSDKVRELPLHLSEGRTFVL
jgi:hypothetical protein